MDTKALEPQLFEGTRSELNIKSLIAGPIKIVDSLPEAIEDLFKIEFPSTPPGSPEYKATLAAYIAEEWNETAAAQKSIWAYFPWKSTLVRLPEEQIFYKLRTARNKFLITQEEQDIFYNSTIAIAGMSVGSSVLNSIVLSGGGNNLRLADFDTLSITNLNRLFSSVCDLTESKLIAACRRIYEINPFANITQFADGLTDQNIQDLLKDASIYIEEIDDIYQKIQSRIVARERRIPVVMATDNGDNAIIDVERYDLDANYPLFHGAVAEEILQNVPRTPTQAEKVKLASAIVGADVTPRTRQSLMMVGQTIPSWPQLGTAATIAGAATAYMVRRILIGEDVPSGRYEVNIDSVLDIHYHDPEVISARQQDKEDFLMSLDLIFGEEE